MTAIKTQTNAFMEKHFTCSAVSYQQILALFFPILLENALNSGFALINSSMISSGGMAVLSAVSLVDTYIAVISTLFQGITSGAGIVVAQYRGARNRLMEERAANQSLSAVAAMAVVIALFSALLRRPIFAVFFGSAEQAVLDAALPYMMWNSLSLPFYAYMLGEIGVLRSMGEAKTALCITMVFTLLYVSLNFLFIVVLKLSVTGLILSVCISRVLAAVGCHTVKRLLKSNFRYTLSDLAIMDGAMLRRIFKLSIPVATGNLLFHGGRLLIQTILVPMGTAAVSSYNITFNILAVSQIPCGAVLTALFTACGMCIGASRPDEARKLHRNGTAAIMVLNVLVAVAILSFNHPLIRAFHADETMAKEIFHCLLLLMPVQVIFYSPAFLSLEIAQAAGDLTFGTVMGALSMWVFRVFGSYAFGTLLDWGVFGTYIALSLDWVFRSAVFLPRFLRGKWESMHVI